MSNPPKHLVLMGIQGSGKGTQARKIAEKFDYILFDTGAELRNIAKETSQLGQKIKSIIESGNFVSADDLAGVIEHFIAKNSDKKLLFDGPVRTREQDKIITPILGEFTVIHLQLDTNRAIERLSGRRIDPETNEVFPADFEGNINPKTGNTLVHRADDTPEAIKNRIKTSLEETLPIVEKWEQKGYKIYHIDADDSIENVFKKISKPFTSHL